MLVENQSKAKKARKLRKQIKNVEAQIEDVSQRIAKDEGTEKSILNAKMNLVYKHSQLVMEYAVLTGNDGSKIAMPEA
ncbi:MAG: hypothetical protein CMF60_00975 [Magnetococcales bacterium]|nr:hypothetical protein [Magnetococcales bacterium]|tara:strand:+ start:6084 stop:6317 length:234 start_codon:yes stop_codon:yes gene_type:complete